jgi:hypothetical protein
MGVKHIHQGYGSRVCQEERLDPLDSLVRSVLPVWRVDKFSVKIQ